jgi:hypothetical protein
MVYNATFYNISAISWRSVLFGEETGVSGENHHPPAGSHKIYHIMLYRVHHIMSRFDLATLVMIGTNSIDSCIPSYHTITTTVAPIILLLVKLVHNVSK